jgi:hypothetical protein
MRAIFNVVQRGSAYSERQSFRWWESCRVLVLYGSVLTLLASFGFAAAQTAAPDKAPSKTESDQRKAPEQAIAGPSATVDGFRAARFGMTEEQVRQAIGKDFPGSLGKLKKRTHPSEKTTVLSLPVSDLLPHAATAQISYILGYKSKKLIQINVVWRSEGSDESDQSLVGAANSLRDYFAAQNYKPGTVVANRQLNENAIVVFRGADAQDRIVLVLLNGAAGAARKDEKQPPPPPLSLELSYIADPANPDVFRIGKGQF